MYSINRKCVHGAESARGPTAHLVYRLTGALFRDTSVCPDGAMRGAVVFEHDLRAS